MSEPDRRELILARLAEVCASVTGIKEVFRNRIEVAETRRPCIIILDADEAADVNQEIQVGIGRPAAVSPSIVQMTPEIYIILGKDAADIGSALNAVRIQLLKLVPNDQTLISLTKDGDIRYLGFSTGFASGRSMEGEAGISFQFTFVVRPSKL